MARRARRQIALAVCLVACLTALAACTPKLDYGKVPIPAGTVPDSSALPSMPAPTAWSPDEIKALADPGYGSDLLNTLSSADLTQREAALLTVMSQSGIATVDPMLHNRVILGAKLESHGMWIQAGQAVILASVAAEDNPLPLDALAGAFTMPVAGTGDTGSAWRTYMLSALQSASTPSELAWRDFVEEGGPQSPSITEALGSQGDYQLTALQATLLESRTMGDAATTASWLKSNPKADLSKVSSSMPLHYGIDVKSASILKMDNPAGPCGGLPIPDWIYTATSAATGKFWDWATKAVDIGTKGAAGKLLVWASGVAGLAATLTNFVLTAALLSKKIDADHTPITRTKRTDQDQERANLTATFSINRSPLQWANCLRVIAAIKTLDAAVPDAGPWANTTVNWKIDDGPAVFGSGQPTASTITSAQGTTTVVLAGKHQDEAVGAGATQMAVSAHVEASPNPDSMKSAWDHLAQWSSNLLELAFGLENPVVWSDIVAKVVIAGMNRYGAMLTAHLTVPMIDWTPPSDSVTVSMGGALTSPSDGQTLTIPESGAQHWKLFQGAYAPSNQQVTVIFGGRDCQNIPGTVNVSGQIFSIPRPDNSGETDVSVDLEFYTTTSITTSCQIGSYTFEPDEQVLAAAGEVTIPSSQKTVDVPVAVTDAGWSTLVVTVTNLPGGP
ncbi:hypothetical protein ACFVU2_19250 [Leifsonia sp. NPDC058194]|uniref:hypothetical protein n=1 Tax=Leifsonia sp. NPDC058194 TaxID=3346374 RepID=UPI0036DA41CA